MAATTHSEFNAHTEAAEVAKAFASGIKDKIIIVTGVNLKGIGYTTAQAFASQHPAQLIITGRSPSKLQESLKALQQEFPDVHCRVLQVDLSSQTSVRDAADTVLAWDDVPQIDIIINSAGVMCLPTRQLSKEGIEMHFATNHIGHWLLSCLLMPKLIAASKRTPKGSTRVINVSSASPTISTPRWSDINFDTLNKDLPEDEQPPAAFFHAWGYEDVENKSYIPLDGYNRSKVAQLLSSIAFSKRTFEKFGILSITLHPGVIQTELVREFPTETLQALAKQREQGKWLFKSQAAGAATSLVAALDPKLAVGVGETKGSTENWGMYLADCQIWDKATPQASSSQNAERMWELSEKLVGQSFAW